MDSSISFDVNLGYWLPFIDYVLVPTSEYEDSQYTKQKRVYYIPDLIYNNFKKDVEYLDNFLLSKKCGDMKNYFIIVKKSTFQISTYQSYRSGKSIDILNYNNVITKRSNTYNSNRVFNSINPVRDSLTFVKNISKVYLEFLSGNTDLRETVFVIRLINQKTNFYSHASLSDTQRLTFKKLLFTSFYFFTNIAEYPIRDNLVEFIYNEKNQRVVENHAESVKVLVPQDIFSLMREYIKLGYSKNFYMDVNPMIVRFLTKRFLFYYSSEHFGLRTFEERKNFKKSGEDAKKYILDGEFPFQYIKKNVLDDYLSYRESYIASFLGISSFTFLINNGGIQNSGIYSGDHISKAVYVGICGPIFNEPLKYDHETLLVTEKYHTKTIKDGYMELWIKYFGENKTSIVKGKFSKNVEIPSYNFIKDNEKEYNHRYIHLVTDNHENLYFDVHGFMKRVESSYKLYLYDISSRTKDNLFEKVWIIFTNIIDSESFINVALQTRLVLITILRLIQKFKKEKGVKYVFEINNFDLTDVKLEEFINNKNIILGDDMKFLTSSDLKKSINVDDSIIFTNDPPFSGICTHSGVIYDKNEYNVFCNYLSNVKSLPGNDYWDGNLKTMTSSAACCSTISQLHNPYINYKMLDYKNFRVVDF